MALNIAEAFFVVFGVFLPDPSDALIIILAAAPILAVMMMIVWSANFRLDIRGDGTRHTLFYLFILPGIALAWRADADMQLVGSGMRSPRPLLLRCYCAANRGDLSRRLSQIVRGRLPGRGSVRLDASLWVRSDPDDQFQIRYI